MKTEKWSWICESCGYGREYDAEWQVAQSSAMHRSDYPGHITVAHCGPISEIFTPARG